MRLLIVEDEIRIREGIQKLLGKMRQDYEIVGEAENGEEGLRLLKDLKLQSSRQRNLGYLEIIFWAQVLTLI